MTLKLRDYQEEAVAKILWAKRNNLDGNDLVILPTGAGKSVVIANVVKTLNEPVLILQPSKEILEQNYNKLRLYVDESEIGVYSASMGQKTIGKFTFATIQSIYTKPEGFAHFKLVVIDEAHLVNPKSLGGMFSGFLKAIGSPKCVGFTATPYRMDTMYVREDNGMIRATATTKLISRMKGFFWKRVLYEISVQSLMERGYLCPLEYIDRSLIPHEEIGLNKSRTDFDLEGYVNKLSTRGAEIADAIALTLTFAKSVLVFCSSVAQAERLAKITEGAEVVSGKTGAKDRARIIASFKNGDIKIVFNVGVLTTGFDHPALDGIILARPTRSIGLYYQMLGRGLRPAPGKTSCKVIDLTSTVKNLGRVETIKLVKRDTKWELESETGSWHNKELYSYEFSITGDKPAKKVNTFYEEVKRQQAIKLDDAPPF